MNKTIGTAVLAAASFATITACSSSPAPSATATVTATVATTETATATATDTATATITQTATATAAPSAGHLVGTVANTDVLGFVESAARCDSGDTPVFELRTTASGKEGSKVVVCYGNSGLYYRGARDKAGDPGLTLGDVKTANGGFTVSNKGYIYTMDQGGLSIAYQGVPVSVEPAAECAYWQQ